jgi:hypothetical protein
MRSPSSKRLYLAGWLLWLWGNTLAQPVPALEENIPFLVTFGNRAPVTYGDDDYCQIFFFVVPFSQVQSVYFRVFDPNTGGMHDELFGQPDTQVEYSVYGGNGAFSHEDARKVDPVGNYKSGNLLASKSFGAHPEWDNTWYTFGPFNPREGERIDGLNGFVFKVIAQGISGNDGNLYRYFMSVAPEENIPVEGGNAFTYEYTFRLPKEPGQVSHLYPFVTSDVVSFRQHNFDFDGDGVIRVVSVAKNGLPLQTSGDGNWALCMHPITQQEHNTSLDIQLVKHANKYVKNNNIAFYITNQYGESLPFYTVPIGGIPKFRYNIVIKRKGRN